MFQSVTIIVRITAILADLLHFNFYLVGDFYETDKKHCCLPNTFYAYFLKCLYG